MKRTTTMGTALALMLVAGMSLTALAADPAPASMGTSAGFTALAPVETLTSAEADGLLFMREEEKVARDVYLTLFEQWGLPIFENIAGSESTHMDAVGNLLDRYELPDPTTGKEVGEFTDQTLQALYDELSVQGSTSLAAALQVGASIEEVDILDLQERMAQTERADIRQVYGNLLKGSRNHLRAFTSTLERQTGESYEPQFLDPAAYDEIVSTGTERGPGAGGWGRAGRRDPRRPGGR